MERSLARANVYRLLSLCFSYPDDATYTCITRGERLREAGKSLHLLADNHFEGYLKLFEDVSCGGKKAMQGAMAQAYSILFIDAFPKTAPFRGSEELRKEGPVFEETVSEVLHFFREEGFTPIQEDIPDHIAQQLGFVGILAEKESKASRGEKIRLEEIQLDFLSRFLINRVSAFCRKVKAGNVLPFYSTLGDLTQEFINFEINYLGIPDEKEQDR